MRIGGLLWVLCALVFGSGATRVAVGEPLLLRPDPLAGGALMSRPKEA